MKKCKCVITGLGIVNPAGSNTSTFWGKIVSGKSSLSSSKHDASVFVGNVDINSVDCQLTSRETKKLDRFSIMALAASNQVLYDANCPLTEEARDNIGMIVGNSTAGWSYVEPMMSSLYGVGGMSSVNPYVATSWFPTAVQGEVSITQKFGGYSKTIAAEQLSSGLAIELATRLIQSGRVDAVLAGGSESPLSNIVLQAHNEDKLLSRVGSYTAYGKQAEGFALGEGAAFIYIESEESAIVRGAKIYSDILAIEIGQSLQESMESCLLASSIDRNDIDYVVLSATGVPEYDLQEYNDIELVLGKNDGRKLSSPKTGYGNLIGASIATDIVMACLVFKHQIIPPSVINDEIIQPQTGRHINDKSECAKVKNILINSMNMDGQSCSILLQRPDYNRQEVG
jgi:3-oxoacyl-[acyl-carrier-protein] synthase II